GHFGIDSLTFEIFKYSAGANELDPASTPPIKTISMYNIGTCQSNNNEEYTIEGPSGPGPFCAAWDGSYNLNGMFGKTNGQYGFRARVQTNQVSESAGNISIEQTVAFPGQSQIPIQVNVTNIHTVRSSPTVVGQITGVAAQPYNILYRLSKDATTTIKIYAAESGGSLTLVRTIVDRLPRVGEGTPSGTLTNGDFWDGRDNTGKLMSAGVYLAVIEAETQDMWPETGTRTDLSWPTTIQLGLDPLQITDIAVKSLGPSSTDVAIISYMLTEAATVYVDIYPPETTFSSINVSPPSFPSASLIRRLAEHKDSRKKVSSYWDGFDENDELVCDGNYVYAVWAELPSGAGTIKTQKTLVGTVPISRGYVIAFVSPSSTVIGSSPSVAGLDPFYFKYTPNRDAYITARIRDMDNNIVRTLVENEVRFANFVNKEMWDGKDDSGNYVSSGTYVMELFTNDPFQCAEQKIFSIAVLTPVNMFRITDVVTAPLLGGTSDMASLSFELTQTMWIDLKIYYPHLVSVAPDDWPWESGIYDPVANPNNIVYRVGGMRPGRFKITEFWDGRDATGLLVPDGQYPFTLVAHSSSATNAMYATDKVMTNGYINITRGQIIFNDFDAIPNIPQMYNSSDVVKLPPYEILYGVSRQSSVTVQILNLDIPPQVVATVLSGGIRDGDMIYNEFWDGKYDNGDYVDGGAYNVRIVAEDIASQLTSRATAQMTIDVYPLRIFDVAIIPLTMDNDAVVSYQLSEAMKMATKIYRPGTSFDDLGNPSPPESSSLVKRIVGVRPARTPITEYWDGTDMSLAKVPDGNYVFKVYGSTDTDGIDSLTGEVGSGTIVADDIVISNISVTKGGVDDVCGVFSDNSNSFFAPNPYAGTSGYFKIWVPISGDVSLKIYNIAGDLVFKDEFLNQAGDSNVSGACKGYYCWPKTNLSGIEVTHGVYYYVLRFKATQGTKEICQVVKKILIP
ncbi:MAG: hypothetical protein L6420_06880, partial [Elusimicrobia bacterium]|nr:hypothetical protein [Elusimicrobiota bacterium]